MSFLLSLSSIEIPILLFQNAKYVLSKHLVRGLSSSKITELQKVVASAFQRARVVAGQSVSHQHDISQLNDVRSHEHSDTSW
jgi:hypothetical protein